MTAREASISSSVTSLHVSLTSHHRSARSADGCRKSLVAAATTRHRSPTSFDPTGTILNLTPAKTVCEAAVTDFAGRCIPRRVTTG
jgi:hypothetical protein